MTQACALDRTGRVRCWGRDSNGGLGRDAPWASGWARGVDVDLGGRARRIAVDVHACALMEDNALRCWGTNRFGQLGYPHKRDVVRPAAEGNVRVEGKVWDFALGSNHTCVRKTDGRVQCWGEHVPANPQLPRSRMLAAGGWMTCALLDGRHVHVFGTSPIAGRGTFAVDVDLGEEVARIGCSDGRVWAVTVSGALVRFEQKEDDSFVKKERLEFDAKLRELATGSQTSCGLLDGGRVRCWGDAERAGVKLGLLGVPHLVSQDIRVPNGRDVDLGGKAIAVDVGDLQACALREDGRLFCWGMVDPGNPAGTNVHIAGAEETPVAFGAVRVFDE